MSGTRLTLNHIGIPACAGDSARVSADQMCSSSVLHRTTTHVMEHQDPCKSDIHGNAYPLRTMRLASFAFFISCNRLCCNMIALQAIHLGLSCVCLVIILLIIALIVNHERKSFYLERLLTAIFIAICLVVLVFLNSLQATAASGKALSSKS